jgi:DNA-directed RNA polymerase specialized sigma subunit
VSVALETRVDEADLWRRACGGDIDARGVLIERYMGLADTLAHRDARTSEPMDDLEQVASQIQVSRILRDALRRLELIAG